MRTFINYGLGGHRWEQRGFTLVEILVVSSIIAALAAVWVPRVVQFACNGTEAAENAEWDALHAIIDNMMADQEMASVSPSTAITRVSSTLNWDSTPGSFTASGIN